MTVSEVAPRGVTRCSAAAAAPRAFTFPCKAHVSRSNGGVTISVAFKNAEASGPFGNTLNILDAMHVQYLKKKKSRCTIETIMVHFK